MSGKRLIVSHPTGNANVRALLDGLHAAGLLEEFYTTVACFPGTILNSISNLPGLSELKRRSYDVSLKNLTRSFPLKEVGRILSSKAGFRNLVRQEKGFFSIEAVYETLDKNVADRIKSLKGNKELQGVYAYEDGALNQFIAARKSGITCFYDQPIGYWRAARSLMANETERRPEWASTMTGFLDSEEKLQRKDDEINLSDHIFAASSFTSRTLNEYPGKLPEVHIIPYGFPDVSGQREYRAFRGRPLKVLFVGGLSQRKGLANVFEVAEKLGKRIELTVVGRKTSADCEILDKNLARHTWIPGLPHHKILEKMRENDLLVFPSLFEGFGLVITEAMSQGTPVITTDRTVGPDLINNGVNGWICEAGSSESLLHSIEEILRNEAVIMDAGFAAMETARLRPWNRYGIEIAEKISSILISKN